LHAALVGWDARQLFAKAFYRPLCCRRSLRVSIGSGRNSHGARIGASKALQSHLWRRVRRYPDAKHLIIGHSHGGLIALYALRDEQLREKIAGVVCLSTPFLHVRRVPELTILIALSGWCIAICGWIVGTIYFGRVVGHGAYGLVVASVVVAIALTVAIIPVLIAVKWIWTTVTSAGKSDWELEAMWNNLQVPRLDSNRLLILRSTGDEASLLLNAGQFLRWLVQKIDEIAQLCASLVTVIVVGLVCSLQRLCPRGEQRLGSAQKSKRKTAGTRKLSLGIMVALVSLLQLPIYGLAVCYVFWQPARPVITIILAVLFLPLIFGACFKLMTTLLIAVCHWPVGIDAVMLAGAFEASVEASPAGRYEVLHIDHQSLTGLAHSLLYENDEAIRTLADWIKNKARN